jgi:hypothetical protein
VIGRCDLPSGPIEALPMPVAVAMMDPALPEKVAIGEGCGEVVPCDTHRV